MRAFPLISLASALAFTATAQGLAPSNATIVVSQPLLKVQTAMEAYYRAQSKTNGAWGRDMASVSNAAGEIGIRFRRAFQ
jgi:hypothetical protein